MNNGMLLSRYYALANRLAGLYHSCGESVDDVVSLAGANEATATRASGETRTRDQILADIILGLVSHVIMVSPDTAQGEAHHNTQEATNITMMSDIKAEKNASGDLIMAVRARGFADIVNELENIANARDAAAEFAFGNNISKTTGVSGADLHLVDDFLMALKNMPLIEGVPSLQKTEKNLLEHVTTVNGIAGTQKVTSENLSLNVSVPNLNIAGVSTFACPVQTETDISITQVYLATQKKTILEVN